MQFILGLFLLLGLFLGVLSLGHNFHTFAGSGSSVSDLLCGSACLLGGSSSTKSPINLFSGNTSSLNSEMTNYLSQLLHPFPSGLKLRNIHVSRDLSCTPGSGSSLESNALQLGRKSADGRMKCVVQSLDSRRSMRRKVVA